MPELDGFALVENLRRGRGLAQTRVLMLTSGPRPGDERRARSLGVASYLIKPVKQSDLLDRILDALREPKDLAPARARAGRGTGRRLRVLVAEDNVVNQRVAAGMLERAGHRAALAQNGREAVEKAAQQRFAMILMDCQMPEMDGFEATAEIRKRDEQDGIHTPVIAVTAHAMKGDRERCLAAGMDVYLATPRQPAELVAVLARLAPDTVIDRARLLERVGGDVRALKDVARIFLADAPRRMAGIRRAIARDDPRALRAAAHTLKGALSNFGAQGAVDAAFELQKLGDASDLEDAPAVLERLEGELKAVRAELRKLVGTKAKTNRRKRTAAGRKK
jgi:CheY-like chemotaxis protein